MRLVSFLALALLLTASGAKADAWIHTHDSASGMPMCLDKDSVKLGADNLTHYAVKMCQDAVAQWYAVDCSKNFKVELVVRIYDMGSTERYREITVEDMDSGLALNAMMACHK